MDVRQKVLGDTDLSRARVLEIGALHNPRLRKDEADVSYLDIAPADALRSKYQENPKAAPHLENLVDVDYIWKPGQTLHDAAGGQTFDLVIASHVIEHVANPIGWLAQVSELLTDGGRLSLVVPDKRYCFDANRQLTTVADLVDAYLRGLEAPSTRQIYDCEANFMDVSADELWAGVDVSQRRRTDVPDPDVHAYQLCLQIAASGEYRDEHCSTFTPVSFLRLLATLAKLELCALRVQAIHPTERGSYEFFAMLSKQTDGLAGPTEQEIVAAEAEERRAHEGPETLEMTVSLRERDLIMRKRALMSSIRARLHR